MLSREEVPGQGLDLNLGDGERKCDVFGEVLDFAAQRYLGLFFVLGGVL